jgi:chemotaxis protein CheC
MNRNETIDKLLKLIAQLSIDKASRSLSKIIRTGARIELERAEVVNVTAITAKINEEDREVMGAYIDLQGDAPFKFLFYTDALNSLTLAELILRKQRESMKNFEVYARSAIQEVSNILASAVANVFSQDLGIKMDPTPPVSIHDFVGAIFAEYITNAAESKTEILMIESQFCIVSHNVKCHMFISPQEGSWDALADKCHIL